MITREQAEELLRIIAGYVSAQERASKVGMEAMIDEAHFLLNEILGDANDK